jgi:hypothetical protein
MYNMYMYSMCVCVCVCTCIYKYSFSMCLHFRKRLTPKKKKELRETVDILETKVKKLEQLLRLKDAKIQVLCVCVCVCVWMKLCILN